MTARPLPRAAATATRRSSRPGALPPGDLGPCRIANVKPRARLPAVRQRWSAREIDRGKVVVGVPVGRSVPPAREQRAGKGERGAAGLRGLRSELDILEGVLER